MQRRQFLQQLAGATAVLETAPKPVATRTQDSPAGHTFQGEFQLGSESWKVYEELTKPEGSITFVSSQGVRHLLEKSAEATFADTEPPYLGLKLADIGMAAEDLLANKLLENGDPDPKQVRSAAPPMGSAARNPASASARLPWNTFVGTVECFDTMPVYPSGNTRTYHPVQVELAKAGAPRELHVKFRGPVVNRLQSATVNGIPVRIGGLHNDTVIIETGSRRSFVVSVKLG